MKLNPDQYSGSGVPYVNTVTTVLFSLVVVCFSLMNIHEILSHAFPKLFCKLLSSSIHTRFAALSSLSVPFVWYLLDIAFITYEISKLEAAV